MADEKVVKDKKVADDKDSDSEDICDYLVARTKRGSVRKLHYRWGCFWARELVFDDFEPFPEIPDESKYNAVCRACWPAEPPRGGGAAGGRDSDSSTSGCSSTR